MAAAATVAVAAAAVIDAPPAEGGTAAAVVIVIGVVVTLAPAALGTKADAGAVGDDDDRPVPDAADAEDALELKARQLACLERSQAARVIASRRESHFSSSSPPSRLL